MDEMTVWDATLLMIVRFVAIFVVLMVLMVCLYLFGALSRWITERRARASEPQESSGSG